VSFSFYWALILEKEFVMREIKPSLEKILKIASIFRLEKRKWPIHPAELQSFALELGKSLDFSEFYRCRFIVKSNQELVLDFCLSPAGNGLAPRGTLEVRVPTIEREDTLPLEIQMKSLEAQRVEPKSYCLIEESSARKVPA
jgi:hypothetical protein